MITGKKLASLRKKKGLTQKELSSILGVSEKTISKIENGVQEVSGALNVKIINYFNIEEKKEPKKKGKISPLAIVLGVCLLSLLCFLINLVNISGTILSNEFIEKLLLDPSLYYKLISSVVVIYIELVVTGLAYYILYKIKQYNVLAMSSLVIMILSLSNYLGVILAGSVDSSILFAFISLIFFILSTYKMKN